MKIWATIKENHFAQMAICCALPVVLIIALQFLGVSNALVYPLALGLCIVSHLLMMKFSKGGKACH